jgi:hypothetical protein
MLTGSGNGALKRQKDALSTGLKAGLIKNKANPRIIIVIIIR